ncbi:MAG: O-acetyl-ADP-ribose deacetylase [Christensenellales bacterium]|jgi:O-acetyl-ADP-ribose deacetylase (regulator of RNase III)
MRIRLYQGDITTLALDAIVNAANPSLLGGGGVDGAIHRAAGPKLREFCATLGGAKTGEAKISPGYKLKSTYIIHTVGPVWRGGGENEQQALRSAYQNSLALADGQGLSRIAFPSISTGAYGYPLAKACEVAVETVLAFAAKSLEECVFVLFDQRDYEAYVSYLDGKNIDYSTGMEKIKNE